MLHYSQLRLLNLKHFIVQHAPVHSVEVSDVKRDGTVTVKFRSSTEVSANTWTECFVKALVGTNRRYEQTDTNKVRLALSQF